MALPEAARTALGSAVFLWGCKRLQCGSLHGGNAEHCGNDDYLTCLPKYKNSFSISVVIVSTGEISRNKPLTVSIYLKSCVHEACMKAR